MKKVRNSEFSSNNPALLFSRGVEQIVSDHTVKQPRYEDQELVVRQSNSVKQQNSESFLSTFIQQLFWSNPGRQS
jgi:hypothetical protein